MVGQAWEMPQLIENFLNRNELGASSGLELDSLGLEGPAVLVIGEVVALHPAYVLDYLQSLPMVA